MTDVTTPRELGRFRCWVIPPSHSQTPSTDTYTFPWDASAFVEEERLIPERISTRPCGMGSASFRVLRELREENGQAVFSGSQLRVGCYVAVTTGEGAFSLSAVIFCGYINRLDLVELKGLEERVGSANALGLGYILDGTQLNDFLQAEDGGVPSDLENPPTFNLQGDGGVVVGNMVLDSLGNPVFAKLPAECLPNDNLFSRKAVIDHLVTYGYPDGVPNLTVTYAAGVEAYLDQTDRPEVFDVAHLTFKGALDLLISRVQGFGWDIYPEGSGWTIDVYPMIDSNSFEYDEGDSFPYATPEDVDLADTENVEVSFTEDAADLYDEVEVRGQPIVFGVTLSVLDGNLVKGWTTAQETAYRNGAQDAADYEDLSEAEKAARNEQLRNSSGLADVFQLYRLNTSDDPEYFSTPGLGDSPDGPLIPGVSWNGTVAAIDPSETRTPYMAGLRFARFVPWQDGVAADGSDGRNSTGKASPTYMTPRVYRYDAGAADGENVCADLLAPDSSVGRSAPSVTPDDNSPGIRIRFNPPEIPARNHWDDEVDAVCRIDGVEANAKTFDYETLCVTVGIPSDQRVSVIKRRDGVPENQVRRRLVITDDNLQCWVMSSGSIVGCTEDGFADRITADTFVRNDFPACERLAATIAAFAFRKRTSVVIQLAEPDNLPAWAFIGNMIGELTERDASDTYPAIIADAYTVIEGIDYDLTRDRPRVTIATTLPSPPQTASGSGSPSAGGSVSLSLGGTTAQAISQEQQTGISNARRTMNSPTTTARDISDPAVDGSSIRMTIEQANTFAAEDVVYNNAGTWALARANSVATALYSGVIESADAASFVVVLAGRIDLALTPGTTYYLSDATAGLLVAEASVTANELKVPVLRCISATECVVIPGRDAAIDMDSLTLGSLGSGGGKVTVNLSATQRITIDTTGVKVINGSDTVASISPAGVITADTTYGTVEIDGEIFVSQPGSGSEILRVTTDNGTHGGQLVLTSFDAARDLVLGDNGTDMVLQSTLGTTKLDVNFNGGLKLSSGGHAIGFFGSSGTGRPTITGSRGGNAALASLLTALASMGLITNSSS